MKLIFPVTKEDPDLRVFSDGARMVLAVCAVLFVMSIVFIIVPMWHDKWQYQWRTGPCGNEFVIGNYILGEDLVSEKDGAYKHVELYANRPDGVYQIERGPLGADELPQLSWKRVMERSPEACAAWIAETGIDYRPKPSKSLSQLQ